MQDDDLDRLLADAARNAPVPSPALMQRVLADAIAHQPPVWVEVRAPTPKTPGPLHRLSALFGGVPALAGLVSAAALGVAVGYLSPATLDLLTGQDSDTAEFFPEADFLATEG